MEQVSTSFVQEGMLSLRPIIQRLATLTFSLFMLTTMGYSQKKFERSKDVDLLAGTAYYIGEMNPYKHFGTRLKGAGGLAFRNNFDRRWTLRSSVIYGVVEAWDADNDDAWIRNRNLNFKNQLIEGSIQGELNFFNYQLGNREYPFTPYLFGGIAYTRMRPMTLYKGSWYETQPIGTEGQGTSLGGDRYKTNIFAVPFGAGIKFNLFAIFGMSIEWGVRKTWTDYIDDVSGKYVDPAQLAELNGQLAATLSDRSINRELPGGVNGVNTGLQRGDPGRKDYYFFGLVSLNVRIDRKATSCEGFN
jgi:hypothetical protein